MAHVTCSFHSSIIVFSPDGSDPSSMTKSSSSALIPKSSGIGAAGPSASCGSVGSSFDAATGRLCAATDFLGAANDSLDALEGLRGFRSGLRGRGRRLGSARSFATAARFTRTCSAMSNTSSRVTLAFPAAPRLFPGDSEGLATTLPPPRASPLPPPRSALVKGALPAHSPEEPPAISPHCPGATTGAGADSAAADFAVDFFGGGEEWSLGDSERSVPDPRLLLLSPSSTSFSCRLCSASSSLLRVSIHLMLPSVSYCGRNPALRETSCSSVAPAPFSCAGGTVAPGIRSTRVGSIDTFLPCSSRASKVSSPAPGRSAPPRSCRGAPPLIRGGPGAGMSVFFPLWMRCVLRSCLFSDCSARRLAFHGEWPASRLVFSSCRLATRPLRPAPPVFFILRTCPRSTRFSRFDCFDLGSPLGSFP
ncbi:hypothetical protein T484DRAFT_1930775 [Baffinella frigidus]|nr:hypothetical protein T484DRAFT_1930775 [Cryptophyta sp. CCMP2293]